MNTIDSDFVRGREPHDERFAMDGHLEHFRYFMRAKNGSYQGEC